VNIGMHSALGSIWRGDPKTVGEGCWQYLRIRLWAAQGEEWRWKRLSKVGVATFAAGAQRRVLLRARAMYGGLADYVTARPVWSVPEEQFGSCRL
jgi:hypothetical protein